MYLSDDSSSHQSLPLTSLETARLIDRQEGFLRHLKVQSKSLFIVDDPTRAAFR